MASADTACRAALVQWQLAQAGDRLLRLRAARICDAVAAVQRRHQVGRDLRQVPETAGEAASGRTVYEWLGRAERRRGRSRRLARCEDAGPLDGGAAHRALAAVVG